MGLLIVGLVLLALHVAGVEPVAGWHWLWIALPFAGAAAWWSWSDASGLTRRRVERRLEERKQARRQRDIEALGLGAPREGERRRGGASTPPAPRSEERGRRDPRL